MMGRRMKTGDSHASPMQRGLNSLVKCLIHNSSPLRPRPRYAAIGQGPTPLSRAHACQVTLLPLLTICTKEKPSSKRRFPVELPN